MSTEAQTENTTAPTTQTTEPTEVTPSDYQVLFEESQQKVRELEDIITASRIKPVTPHPQQDAKPSVTAKGLEARVGRVTLNNTPRAGKLSMLGVTPENDPGDEFLRRAFGKSSEGNDGSLARELMNSNPYRYRVLREAAILLGIYGK